MFCADDRAVHSAHHKTYHAAVGPPDGSQQHCTTRTGVIVTFFSALLCHLRGDIG
jgi:hypothetical protein